MKNLSSEYLFLKGYFLGRELHEAIKAMSFMYKSHFDQKRNDGTFYYEHPLRVCNYLVKLGLLNDDSQEQLLYICCLLHDTLEDTKVTYDILQKEFGEEVASRVKILSKEKNDDLKEYFKNVKVDLITGLVKCSDRIDNLSTSIGVFKPERLQKYVNETEEYIIPIVRYTREAYPNIGGKMCIINANLKSSLHASREYLKLIEKIKILENKN